MKELEVLAWLDAKGVLLNNYFKVRGKLKAEVPIKLEKKEMTKTRAEHEGSTMKKELLHSIQEKEADSQELRLHEEGQQEQATISKKEKKNLETELQELYFALRVGGLAEAKKKELLYCIQEKEADIQKLCLHEEGQQERATVSLKEKKKLEAKLQELYIALRVDRLAEAGDISFNFFKTKNGSTMKKELLRSIHRRRQAARSCVFTKKASRSE